MADDNTVIVIAKRRLIARIVSPLNRS